MPPHIWGFSSDSNVALPRNPAITTLTNFSECYQAKPVDSQRKLRIRLDPDCDANDETNEGKDHGSDDAANPKLQTAEEQGEYDGKTVACFTAA